MPSFWNMVSKVLNATGLTMLRRSISTTSVSSWGMQTYYPSTPASNARRLSSKDDIPVNANIREACAFCSELSDEGLASFRVVSIDRICDVAPTPTE